MYSEAGMLLYVQLDHLNSEIIGTAIDYFYGAGASNVNVLSTVTKNNRPGHIMLIDTKPELADQMEEIIYRELGSSGWHRLETDHRHLPVAHLSKEVKVALGDKTMVFVIEGKRIGGDKPAGIVRPEHRSCVAFRAAIKDTFGTDLPLSETYRILTNSLRAEKAREIHLSEG